MRNIVWQCDWATLGRGTTQAGGPLTARNLCPQYLRRHLAVLAPCEHVGERLCAM